MRGKARSMFLTILIINLAIACVVMVFPQGTADVSIEPARVENIWPDGNFTVDITVTNAEDIQAWDANITFDPTILEVVNASEGEFLKSGSPTFFNYLAPEDAGYIYIAASYFFWLPNGSGVDGSGTLANITFQVRDIGNSPIHFKDEETMLWYHNGTAVAKQPRNLHDGFFTNLHDVAITDLTASPETVSLGGFVLINATVTNEGDFSETFDVTTYWNISALSEVIETKTGVNLNSGTSTTLTFTWNTAGLSTGTYIISAEASAVPDEHPTNLKDNAFTDGEVEIFSPEAPVANFTILPAPPCSVGSILTFNASSSYDPNGHIISYEWKFGDGNNGSGMVVTHAYTAVGDYEVTLTVQDNQTLSSHVIKSVKVLSYPVASFTYSPEAPLVNSPVTFNASSSTPNGGMIVSYAWDLGDGNKTKIVKFTSIEKYADAKNTSRFDIYDIMDLVYRDINQTEPDQVDPGDLRLTQVSWENGTGSYPANSTVKPKDDDVGYTLNLFSGEGHRENILENGEYDCGEIIRLDWRCEEHTYVTDGTFTVTLNITDSEGLSKTESKMITAMRKHDVAVVELDYGNYPSATPKPPHIYVGGPRLGVKVTVKNEGTQMETFDILLYCDNTEIERLTVIDLAPLEERTLLSETGWVLTNLSGGEHYLKAEVPPGAVPGEIDLADNYGEIGPIFLHEINVAVINVVPSQTIVLAGDVLKLNVTVQNKGTGTSPTYTLRVYYNTSTISISPEPKNIDPLEKDGIKTKVFTWDTTEAAPANYTLSAYIKLATTATESNLTDNLFIYGDVIIGASIISIYAFPESIAIGSSTTLNGSITPTRPDANVTIKYRLNGEETWNTITTVITDENSTYSYDWTPETAGTYEVKASWEGDMYTLRSESEILTIVVSSTSPSVLLYVVAAAAAIGIVATAIYLLKFRKPKPA